MDEHGEKSQFYNVVTVVLFLLVILFFTVAGIFTPDRIFSANENRYLTQKPKLTVENFLEGEFSTDYENYISDQFIWRDSWIKIKTVSEILIGKKDVNGVYLCKDDYLIETQTDINEEKAYDNADTMVSFLNKKAEELGDSHVALMIVPTAVVTLKDKLPKYAQTFDQNKYIDYMKRLFGGNFVDVRDTLNSHADEYLYYKTDHHWTTNAAYFAYREWAEKMGFTPYSEDEFEIVPAADDFLGTVYSKLNYAKSADEIYLYKIKQDIRYDVDINMGAKQMDDLYEMSHLETKDKYSVFLDGNNSIVTIDTTGGRKDGETLLIIKDSYAHCFIPFVVNHYEKTVVVDMRYLKMPMNQVIENYGVTDILVLYNAVHFAEDINIPLLSY